MTSLVEKTACTIPAVSSAVKEILTSSTGSSSEDFTLHIQNSIRCIMDTIRIFGAESVAIAFNGGKDACVVLYLLIASLDALQQTDKLSGDIKIVYFEDELEFPQMKTFLEDVKSGLKVEFCSLKSSFKDGMVHLVSLGVRAMLMGSRSADPYTEGLECFSPSTCGYPPFMRVNPILKWRYDHVWEFLRLCRLPYCSLYDEGYTSLGNSENSIKNPALRRDNGSYDPAYTLTDVSLERNSRTAVIMKSSC